MAGTILLLLLSNTLSFASTFEALPLKAPSPIDNPTTLEKIDLGRKLFFDPRLSKSGNVSCNSCHNVMAGGEDMRATSIGHNGQKGGRSAPTVWNAAFLSAQFWDGRAPTLEEQAKGPLTNPIEMAMDSHEEVVDRLLQIPGYVAEFKKVWGSKSALTIDHVAKSIAAYERTLITPNSRFDKFVKGETSALNSKEKRGFHLFQTVGCVGCHSGPNFSGAAFQKFPLIPNPEIDEKFGLTKDLGRFAATKNESDKNFWRVPTLRNITLTAPYFHNGSVQVLNEAVRIMAKTQLNRDLKVDEVNDLVAFLGTLTGEFPKQNMPRLPDLIGSSVVTQ